MARGPKSRHQCPIWLTCSWICIHRFYAILSPAFMTIHTSISRTIRMAKLTARPIISRSIWNTPPTSTVDEGPCCFFPWSWPPEELFGAGMVVAYVSEDQTHTRVQMQQSTGRRSETKARRPVGYEVFDWRQISRCLCTFPNLTTGITRDFTLSN